MPDVIWVKQYGPGLGGVWYPYQPTESMFIFADFVTEEEKIQALTFHKYVKDETAPEIFAWITESTTRDPVVQLRYFRLEAHPGINPTVGYRKAE